jgi:heme O synthase-like polyprenyltransferase
VAFARREDTASARKLLRVSLVYLPVLLAVLVYDHYRLLDWGR